MEPTNQFKKDREFRKFETFEIRALEEGNNDLIVEGYALTFDSPTVMYELQGVQYKEVISARALDSADMTDVIFNYDHVGKVMARTRNNTLQLTVDQKGLHVKANLGGTEEAHKIYEEIIGGYVDKMSFSFLASSNEYDKSTKTRTITGIKRLFDVSAVSIPAYQSTSISARSFFEAEAEMERKAVAEQRERLKTLSFITGGLKA